MTVEYDPNAWKEWEADEKPDSPYLIKGKKFDKFLENGHHYRVYGAHQICQIMKQTEFSPIRCWEIYGIIENKHLPVPKLNALLEMTITQDYLNPHQNLDAPDIQYKFTILEANAVEKISERLNTLQIPVAYMNEELFGLRGGKFWTFRYGSINQIKIEFEETLLPKQWLPFKKELFDLIELFESL